MVNFANILVGWGAVLDAGLLGLLPLLGIDTFNRLLLPWLKVDWRSKQGKFMAYCLITIGITRMIAGLFPQEVRTRCESRGDRARGG